MKRKRGNRRPTVRRSNFLALAESEQDRMWLSGMWERHFALSTPQKRVKMFNHFKSVRKQTKADMEALLQKENG